MSWSFLKAGFFTKVGQEITTTFTCEDNHCFMQAINSLGYFYTVFANNGLDNEEAELTDEQTTTDEEEEVLSLVGGTPPYR